ncbi:hypothetical protein AQ505_11500 [Pedobacter sp. PACM 27299]|nr:hypothetical protein AQ505_11500 [Pedobacter sp. PACM 27299]
MNFFSSFKHGTGYHVPFKFLLKMKFIIFFLMINILQLQASIYAQKITLDKKDESLSKIFKEIRSQSNYDFFIIRR